jgi:SAM-dependent methyltransferase
MELNAPSSGVPPLVVDHAGILACPVCRSGLSMTSPPETIECVECGRSFSSENGVPLLFWPNEWGVRADVTEEMKAFYEETPFPGYEDVETRWDLIEKAEKGVFARLLNEQIPVGALVLEAGCGTGQLSNYLGLKKGRTVFGVDMCLNSLKLGQDFKTRNNADHVAFLQMNLFRPIFKHESFDLVISNGVLHHTADPYLAFETISRLVKKGGHIIVGLYSAHGRIFTCIRQSVFRLTGDRLKWLDPRIRNENINDTRKHAWFMDQYKNPHESLHTIDEVLGWFDRTGFEFVMSIPKTGAGDPFTLNEKLFEPAPRGSRTDNVLTQLGLIFKGGTEGGFFIMIGKKKEVPAPFSR